MPTELGDHPIGFLRSTEDANWASACNPDTFRQTECGCSPEKWIGEWGWQRGRKKWNLDAGNDEIEYRKGGYGRWRSNRDRKVRKKTHIWRSKTQIDDLWIVLVFTADLHTCFFDTFTIILSRLPFRSPSRLTSYIYRFSDWSGARWYHPEKKAFIPIRARKIHWNFSSCLLSPVVSPQIERNFRI